MKCLEEIIIKWLTWQLGSCRNGNNISSVLTHFDMLIFKRLLRNLHQGLFLLLLSQNRALFSEITIIPSSEIEK